MEKREYAGSNAHYITIGALKVYFSYETVIAFSHPDCGLVIRENEWGPTTGKHLNAIDDDKHKRIPGDAFEEQWREFEEHFLGGN